MLMSYARYILYARTSLSAGFSEYEILYIIRVTIQLFTTQNHDIVKALTCIDLLVSLKRMRKKSEKKQETIEHFPEG